MIPGLRFDFASRGLSSLSTSAVNSAALRGRPQWWTKILNKIPSDFFVYVYLLLENALLNQHNKLKFEN